MTDDELKAIRKRCDTATPGPWRYDGIGIDQLTDSGQGYLLDVYPDSECVLNDQCAECGKRGVLRRKNGEFIAAARTDIPLLIDEIARLRSLNDAWAESARESLAEMDAAKALANIANECRASAEREAERMQLAMDANLAAWREAMRQADELARMQPVYEAAKRVRPRLRSHEGRWNAEEGDLADAIDAALAMESQ